MSNYESEIGEWTLPSAEFAAFRQAMQKVDHDLKQQAYDLTQQCWKGLTRKQQTDPEEYRKAVSDFIQLTHDGGRRNQSFHHGAGSYTGPISTVSAHARNQYTDGASDNEAIEHARWLLEDKVRDKHKPDPENKFRSIRIPAGKPSRVLQSDVAWPTNRSTSFRMGESSVTFDPATKKVRWSSGDNNHAVERAHELPLGQAFFAHLKKIKWTNGTGGYTRYRSEYHEDEFGGRSGSEINNGWGPLGIDAFNSEGRLASVPPWQNPKGEWFGSEIVRTRGGMSIKQVKGTVTRDGWSGTTKFTPATKPVKKTAPPSPTASVSPTRSTASSPIGTRRGVTPGLPTNSGSFKATEKADSGISLGTATIKTTALPASSPFAQTKDLSDLLDAWKAATSPEMVTADGERSKAAQEEYLARLKAQYVARFGELA